MSAINGLSVSRAGPIVNVREHPNAVAETQQKLRIELPLNFAVLCDVTFATIAKRGKSSLAIHGVSYPFRFDSSICSRNWAHHHVTIFTTTQ